MLAHRPGSFAPCAAAVTTRPAISCQRRNTAARAVQKPASRQVANACKIGRRTPTEPGGPAHSLPLRTGEAETDAARLDSAIARTRQTTRDPTPHADKRRRAARSCKRLALYRAVPTAHIGTLVLDKKSACFTESTEITKSKLAGSHCQGALYVLVEETKPTTRPVQPACHTPWPFLWSRACYLTRLHRSRAERAGTGCADRIPAAHDRAH